MRANLTIQKLRIPSFDSILTVFSVIVFFSFSWNIMWVLFKQSSWLYFLTMAEIINVWAYSLALCLLESLILIGIFILLSTILPVKLFRNQFTAQSTILYILLSFWAVTFQLIYPILYFWSFKQGFTLVITLLMMIVILVYLVHRLPRLQNVICAFAKRFRIFLILYIPLGVLGIILLFIHNIFG